MSMTRNDVETAGWVFVAEQDGYVRAEKFLPNGDLINMQGENVDLVVDACDAWEGYPVQAPNTRTNDLGPDTVDVAPPEAPAEPGVDVAPKVSKKVVKAPVPDGDVPA